MVDTRRPPHIYLKIVEASSADAEYVVKKCHQSDPFTLPPKPGSRENYPSAKNWIVFFLQQHKAIVCKGSATLASVFTKLYSCILIHNHLRSKDGCLFTD